MLCIEKSRKFWLCVGLTALLLLAPAFSLSIEVKNLYDVEVPVANRESTARMQAFHHALASVLIRITGNSTIATKREVASLFKKPDRYVQQYRYVVTGEDLSPLLVQVRFDGVALERFLTKAGQPIWGKERPAVLLWLVVQDNRTRYLLNEGHSDPSVESIQLTAEQRGVPLMFPLLDLQDRNQVSVADIIGGFDDRIRQASERYSPDTIVIARATALNDGFWRTHWRMYFGDQSTEWVAQGTQISDALVEGIHRLATELSNRLAVNFGVLEGSSVILTVDGVDTVEDYARLYAYLASLSPVNSFRPHRIESSQMSFWLQLRGNPLALERLIGLGGVLNKVATPIPLMSQRAVEAKTQPALTLNYQLLE